MQSLIAPNGQSVMLYDSNDPTRVIPSTLINTYSVLTIPAYWRAMNFLAQNLASFPRAVHKDGAGLDVPHPLDGILKIRPNGYQNSTNFWRTLFFNAAHVANGYARIERGPGMRPIALHNVMPGDPIPFRFDADDGNGIQQWYYIRSTKEILPGWDVIHFASLGLDGMVGADPIHLHADTFQRAKTLDKYQTRFLMRGTVLKGSIEIPGSMSEQQLQEFRQRLRTNFRGSEAEDDIIILTDQAALKNATLTPEQSQLIEQAAYTTKQIGQVTGVHPYYLYDDRDGKYNNNTEQAGIDVLRYTFRPWIDLAEDELSGKLLTTAELKQGLRIHLDPAVITRGDSTTITNTVVAQTNAGLRTPNEGRKMLELPPDPDPKSDKLRLLGDTTVNKPEPPKQNSAIRPRWSNDQWDDLEAECMELAGECEGENATAFSLKVHKSGAIGSDVAATYFPPGTTIGTQTIIGQHTFTVGEHAPHAHPNWVVPGLIQTSGPDVPGEGPLNFGHLARMAAGSRVMGYEPSVTVRRPPATTLPTPAYAAAQPPSPV